MHFPHHKSVWKDEFYLKYQHSIKVYWSDHLSFIYRKDQHLAQECWGTPHQYSLIIIMSCKYNSNGKSRRWHLICWSVNLILQFSNELKWIEICLCYFGYQQIWIMSLLFFFFKDELCFYLFAHTSLNVLSFSSSSYNQDMRLS